MTLAEFLSALRILRSIDRPELVDAGLQLGDLAWRDFRDNPYRWICLACDKHAIQLWSIVRRRMPKEKG